MATKSEPRRGTLRIGTLRTVVHDCMSSGGASASCKLCVVVATTRVARAFYHELTFSHIAVCMTQQIRDIIPHYTITTLTQPASQHSGRWAARQGSEEAAFAMPVSLQAAQWRGALYVSRLATRHHHHRCHHKSDADAHANASGDGPQRPRRPPAL